MGGRRAPIQEKGRCQNPPCSPRPRPLLFSVPFKHKESKPSRQVSHPVWEDDFLPSSLPFGSSPQCCFQGRRWGQTPSRLLCSSLPVLNGPPELCALCVASAHSSGTTVHSPSLKRFHPLIIPPQSLKREETSKYEGPSLIPVCGSSPASKDEGKGSPLSMDSTWSGRVVICPSSSQLGPSPFGPSHCCVSQKQRLQRKALPQF